MTTAKAGPVLRHLRTLTAGHDDATPDDQLLQRFAATRDEAAFAALVRRHGPMVLGVCRRLLRQEQDAEDVFQATFLVLARRAGAVRRTQSVASWLHGVAGRLSLKARTGAARRSARPLGAVNEPAADPPDELSWREVRGALDEELGRLPEKYRAPLVLCYLEGLARDEAAARLGCPLGTLKGRLERGRDLLRRRLTRRGLALSAALAAVALERGTLSAALAAATARAAVAFAAGAPSASAPVALARAALRATALARWKVAAALLLGLALLAAGAGLPAPPAPDAPPATESKADREPTAPARLDVFGDPLPAGALARMGTVRLRHADGVLCVVFCPDGKTLITGSHDGTLRQWSLADGKEVRHFGGHEFEVRHMALSPDGKLLAAWGQTPPGVYLWDVATGKGGLRIRVAAEGECCLAWGPDNRTLAGGGEDGTVRLWDTTTGQELLSVAAHKKPVPCVAFSPDGKRLATAGRDGTLRLIDVAGKDEPRTLRAREDEFHFVAFSRDGKDLISAGDRYRQKYYSKIAEVNTVAVWDAATGERRRDFRVGDDQDGSHEGIPPSVALAPDGTTLAFGYWDHTIRLWDLTTGKPLRRLTGFPDRFYPAYHVAFSPDGRTLAAAGSHNAVCLLDVATGKRLLKEGTAQERDIRSVALSADGRLLATACPDQTIVLWDAATGKPRRELRGHDGWVYSAALTADARTVVSGGSDGTVRLWDAATGKELRKMAVPFNPPPNMPRQDLRVERVAISPDGKLLASSHSQSGPGMVLNGPDGIRLWDAATGKELRKLEKSPGDPCFLSFSADGKVLIAANSDRSTVHLWNVATGKEVGRCNPLGEKRVYEVAVTADGRLAALSDFEGRITLADVSTGRTLLTIRRPAGLFYRLAFSADGQFLALACASYRAQDKAEGRGIELWEVASGKMVCRHAPPPGNAAVSAAVSADGRSLVTGMYDTTALVWDLAPELPKGAPRQPEDLWTALAGEDVARAYQALVALTATPDEALALLKRHLRPAAGVDRQRVLALVADLDSDEFAVRERAAKALEDFGPEANPVFAEVLSGKPSAEVRHRLEALQAVSPLPVRSADVLRSLRAVVALERIGTPEARQLLEALAKGAPAARQTAEAKAALGRLANRPPPVEKR
jgi:RNA polymerase sigma factor (sigma-70 family)